MKDDTYYAWSDPEGLVSIDIPEPFAPELYQLAQRWDQGLTTTEDDVAALEIAVAYLTGNLSEAEAVEYLGGKLADLRGLVRDAAQNGMYHAGKEGRAALQLSRFDGKIKPIEASTPEAAEKDGADDSAADQAPRVAAGHTVSRYDDRLAAMMQSSKIPIKE